MCSAKRRDNLLVETDIICHLWVSFCVTRNALIFTEIKKGRRKGTVQQVFYALTLLFSYLVEFLLLFALHNFPPHCNGSTVIFDGCWIKLRFTQISSYIKDFNSGKNMGPQYFRFKLIFMIGYNNQFKVVQRKFLCK